MWVNFKYHTARTAECRELVVALGCHPPVVGEGASRAQLATTRACFKSGLSFFFNIESSTTEDNNIFCYFYSLYPSNCETSTTGDNQSLLQVQLKFFGQVNQAQLTTTIIFLFFFIQPIVKLAQLATTRTCFKPSL